MYTSIFKDMPLSHEIKLAIADMGFEEATPIQSQCIELILAGEDITGQSQTGTGKTAAFAIPILERIDSNSRAPQALVLTPTRELALQICEEFNKLLKYRKARVLAVYGGQSIERQINALRRGTQILVGTPGRIMDHINRGTLSLESIKLVTLDEADEMLDMGFREDIEFILSKTPETRQTLLFSATMPNAIISLAKKYQRSPKRITVEHKTLSAPNISQTYFEVREPLKLEALCRLLDCEAPELVLVFCNTKKRCDEVTERLQGRGYFAECLHGDMKQAQRDSVMRKFRTRTLEILVATDVAARGLDVENVDAVINYDIPQDEEYYVHRIGRTGRAGKAGKAFTFVSGRETYKLREIANYTRAKIARGKLPTLLDVEEVKASRFRREIEELITAGGLEKYGEMVSGMPYEPLEVAAALLKRELYDEGRQDVVFEEPPRRSERFDRSSSERFSGSRKKGSMVRLTFNVGKRDKIKPGDLVGAIAGEAGVSGRAIGQIEIYDDSAMVDVQKSFVEKVIRAMKTVRIRGKRVRIAQANE